MIAFASDPRVRAQLLTALSNYSRTLHRNGGLLHPELLLLMRELDSAGAPNRATSGQEVPLSASSCDSANHEHMAILLSVQQAAALLGISERTVKRRMKDGSIPSELIGGLRRIRRSDLPTATSERDAR